MNHPTKGYENKLYTSNFILLFIYFINNFLIYKLFSINNLIVTYLELYIYLF